MTGRWTGGWHVLDGDRRSLESHATEAQARHACEVVNDHEMRCGREPRYLVVFLPERYRKP